MTAVVAVAGAQARDAVAARPTPRAERDDDWGCVAGEAGGPTAAFEEFARDRLPSLLRYAVMLCRDRELAEDVVQDVLIRAHGRWDAISAVARPDLYVKRMVTNDYLSWRRRRRLRTVSLQPDAVDAATRGLPPPPEQTSSDREALWAELARLPRQQQVVLVLRFYEGLTDLEIATVLECRPGTVRGYASRALASLRIDLADWHLADEPLGGEAEDAAS